VAVTDRPPEDDAPPGTDGPRAASAAAPHGPDLDGAARAVGRRLAAILGGHDTRDTPGAQLPDAQIPRAGQRLGDYAIVRELGAGGMGTVLLAERADGTFTRQVALKLIRGFPTEDGRKRLRRERQILAELDHPAIARLLDGGETDDGQPYLVMEYVPGQGLLEHVAARGLTLSARVELWCTIAEAVAHAHQRLVVHRDLKPSNVLVREDGQPKLLDFGIAKLVDLGDDTDRASTRVYSPGYASPEQLAGRPITTRTDVHALGTLLRELLLGMRGDDRPSEPPIGAVRVDADLAAIVERARTAEPSGRYATVEAMLEDVRRWRGGLPVRARGQNLAYRARKLLWRWRLPVALAAAALVGTAVFVVQLRDSRDRALDAEAQARAAQTRAEAAARRANKLLEFVTTTFQVAAPDNTLGREVSLHELLAAARKQVDTAAPEDSRELRLFLGELHAELGEHPAAIELVRAATIAAGEPRTVDDGRWLAAALTRQAEHLATDARGEAAVAAALRAEELRTRFVPDDRQLARDVQLALGFAYHTYGDQDAAAQHLLPIVTATLTPDDPALFDDMVEATHYLAGVEGRRGDGAAVLRYSARLQRLMSRFPPDHPRQRFWLRHAGNGEQLEGRYGPAMDYFRRAIAVLEPAVDGRGGSLLGLYNDLGVAAADAGRFRVAVEALDRALTLASTSGSTTARAHVLGNLASMAEANGDYARAEALFDEVTALEAPTAGPERRAMVRGNRARTVALRGRYDEARRELEAVRREQSPEDPSADVFTTLRLAQLEVWAGRPAPARAYLEALSRHVDESPSGAPLRRLIRRARAQVSLLDGDATRALGDFAALEPEYAEVFGDEAYDTDLIRVDRARALAALGRADEARALLKDILPRLREATGPNERNLVKANELARSLGL
jgi:tetratricopeptide (TPR) repeat protein